MSWRQGMPALSGHHKAAIRRLSADGLGHRAIARALGLAHTTVARARYHMGCVIPRAERPKDAEPVVVTDDPRTLYRYEKARRAERLSTSHPIAEAKRDFAALLQREREAGKGGRPKKVSGFQVPSRHAKPGKPMIVAVREDPADALLNAVGYYGGEG